MKECLTFFEEKVLPLLNKMPHIASELTKEQPQKTEVLQEPKKAAKKVSLFEFYKEKKGVFVLVDC